MIPCFLSNARIKSPILLQYPAHVKADLDGTIFTYDYRARLAYVMTSRQIVSGKLDPRHPYDMCGFRK